MTYIAPSMPFMASTLPATSLKIMMLSLLLITIYIFVGIKISVAYSAHINKWAIKIFSKEMLQTHADNSQSKISMPFLSMKQRRGTFAPNLICKDI